MFGAPFCPSCLACIHICCWTLLVPETTYIPFFATPKRWTDEQVHHLWVWAFDFRRGVGRVGWTHGLLASQLPPRTWKQFWPFLLDHQGSLFKKRRHHPNPSDIFSNWSGKFTLPEAKRIAPPEVWWLEDHLISLSTFISECCKENIPDCNKHVFCYQASVFFSKKDLEETNGTVKATSPWFGRYRCHQKVDGWVVALAWRQLGVAEDRFCSPRNEGPASSPWNPGNVSQKWFYLDGCDSGIQFFFLHLLSSSRDLVLEPFLWPFSFGLKRDLPFGGINPGHEWKKLPGGFLKGWISSQPFDVFFGDHSSQHLENMSF